MGRQQRGTVDQSQTDTKMQCREDNDYQSGARKQ